MIMPPTLSLDKNNYYIGDEVILSGQTVPKSRVSLSMFTKQPVSINLIKKVEAFSLPQVETTSDDKGNFSISLPSSSNQTFRLFAQTNYLENSSPDSRKLTVKILPWWMIIFELFLLLFEIIKSRLLEFIILLQIVSLVNYFLRRYLHPRTLAIEKRGGFSLMKKSDFRG